MRISDWSSDVCSSDLPRQDVGLVTADLTRRPAARLANSPTHLITELAATQKRFAAATLSDGSRQVQRLVTMYRRPADATVGYRDRRDGGLSYPHLALGPTRSEEHTSELQSLMRISYAVFCLKKNNTQTHNR